jgi:N-acyl-L-homoserine lactone synthetase
MGYTRDEQETTCVYDKSTDQWTVYTCARNHIGRLLRRFGEPFWKETEPDKHGKHRIIAARWTVPESAVRFAKNAADKAGFQGNHDEEGQSY